MMPLSGFGPHEPALTHEHVYDISKTVLNESFDRFEINGYNYSNNEVWDVLLYASANRLSIKGTCESLDDAPSYNWIYTVLKEEMFETASVDMLEQQANAALKEGFPKRLSQRRQKLAIDLVLIPYYGDETTIGIYRSQAKNSTTKFFCYASAYLINKNKRVTVCFTYVRPQDTLLDVLVRLLKRVQTLKIRLKRLYLDRGFAQVDVIRYLKGRHYVTVVALPKRGEQLKAMQRGKKSMTTTYTMNSKKSGRVTFPLWMACRYQKGKAKNHGVAYLFFAVLGNCRSPVLQVAKEYRHRFGIEASYRIMNAARAVTTSTNVSLRLLLVAIAFILTNIWVWFKWNITLISRHRGTKTPTFTLNLFALFITEYIKRIYRTLNELKL
jgi:putative transposase